MTAWLYYALGGAFTAFLGATIWLVTFIFKEKNPEQDAPIILNFLTRHANGRMLGVVKKVEHTRHGRLIMEYDARDVDLNRVVKNKEDTTTRVIVPQNKVLTFPKGTVSADRNLHVTLPINAEDLHPAIRETPLGQGLMLATEMKNFEMQVEKILREGTSRRDNLLQQLGDGEISKVWATSMYEKMEDFAKMTVNKALKDKGAGIPAIPGAQNYS